MPTSPDSPRADGSHEYPLTGHPYLDAFLRADSNLALIEANSLPETMQRTFWLNSFADQTTKLKQKLSIDYMHATQDTMPYQLRLKLLKNALDFKDGDLFEGMDPRKIPGVLTPLFLIGYSVHNVEILDEFFPHIIKILHTFAHLRDGDEAQDKVAEVIEKGRQQWVAFFGEEGYDPDVQEASERRQAHTEKSWDSNLDAFIDVVRGLNLDTFTGRGGQE